MRSNALRTTSAGTVPVCDVLESAMTPICSSGSHCIAEMKPSMPPPWLMCLRPR